MDNAVLVDELKKVVTAVRKEKGHIALFMLTATDIETAQTWNLIVSATGYDQSPIRDAVVHLVNLMRENISKDHLRSLTRATILKTSDSFVKAMNQAFNVRNSAVRIPSSTIFGIFIEAAILLESQKPLEKSGEKKTKATPNK